MKIQYLHVKNYKQFSDLELDLTYPKGHKKAGEPLDKICIIGQSGTGKTNLLDIIKKSTIDFSEQSKNSYLPFSKFVGESTDDRYITTKFKTHTKVYAETLFTKKSSKITFKTKKYNILENEKSYFVSTVRDTRLEEEIFEEEIDTSKMSSSDKALLNKLTNAKAELVLESINEDKKSTSQILREKLEQSTSLSIGMYSDSLTNRKKTTSEKRQELNRAIEAIEEKYISVSKSLRQLKRNNFIDKHIVNINDETNSLWITMKEKINNYQSDRSKYIDELSNKILVDDEYDKKHFKKDVKSWEQENENLLEKIANDINFILEKFNLKLTKIDENQQSYNALTIKDLSNDTILEYDDLSTGTKNLLSTFIPLKTYTPKDSPKFKSEVQFSS